MLQSTPIYVVSTTMPHICVIKELHKSFSKYFWSNKELDKSKD